MIPKRIFCTHVSRHALEPKLKYCMNLMQEFHPSWEFVFFSDGDSREFVKDESPDYLELYDWYPRPVMRTDLFRLLVVYQLGGFYLDTDFLLKKNLIHCAGKKRCSPSSMRSTKTVITFATRRG